jgi:hypothetical protein
MTATQMKCVSAYERTRQWGERAGGIRIGIRIGWNAWLLKWNGSDVRRLRIIALQHGLHRSSQ